MDKHNEQEACMKIYTPRVAKTPTTSNTAEQEPEQVRIWNGSRTERDSTD